MFNSAWITDKKRISILQKELPALKGRDLRIRIQACGICGTDIHFFREYPENRPLPLGHEPADIVEETGAEVTMFKKGDTA